jgi:hypothetical protein
MVRSILLRGFDQQVLFYFFSFQNLKKVISPIGLQTPPHEIESHEIFFPLISTSMKFQVPCFFNLEF